MYYHTIPKHNRVISENWLSITSNLYLITHVNNNNLKWLKKKKTSLTSNSVTFFLWKNTPIKFGYFHSLQVFLFLNQLITHNLSGCSSGSGKSQYVTLWLAAQWIHYPPKPVLNVLAQVQSTVFYVLLVNMYYWNSHIHCEHPGHKNDSEHACVTIGSIIFTSSVTTA